MTTPTVGQTRLVIVGASGMVGGYALRYALDNSAVASVTSIGRRKLGISHPKLKEVLHPDFAECSALAETLSSQDAAIFCLGVYTGAVSDATTHDNRRLHNRQPGCVHECVRTGRAGGSRAVPRVQ